MKKTIVCMLAIAGFATSAYSQTSTVSTELGNTTFGIRAGVNFQNLNGKDESDRNLKNKMKVGFNIGANAEIAIAQDFYVQPGLLFSTKGAKIENTDIKVNLSYLEIPINLLYKPVLGDGKLLLGFGPYLGFAVGGKVDDTDIKFEKEISQAESETGTPYLKRFDAGANLLVGYELSSRISAQLNAQLGLVNIQPKITGLDTDAKTKNTGFGISIGYRF